MPIFIRPLFIIRLELGIKVSRHVVKLRSLITGPLGSGGVKDIKAMAAEGYRNNSPAGLKVHMEHVGAVTRLFFD